MNMNIGILKTKYLLVYYLVLVFAYFYLMRPNVELSLPLRVFMFGITFIPVFLNTKWLPFSILCFYGISSTSFCNVLPATTLYYVFVVVLCYILSRPKGNYLSNSFLVFSYFILVSLVYLDFDACLAWVLIMLISAEMIKDVKDLSILFYAFIVISIFLSLLFFVYYSEFLVHYGSSESDLERSGWINPNSFGAAIGSGGLLSVAYITRLIKLPKNKSLILLCSITIALSFVSLALNASRGAFLAFVVPSFMMLMVSKTKPWVKVLVWVLTLLFVVWMLRNNVFELLLSRLNEDTLVTGGSRIKIWKSKLYYFVNTDNFLYMLFGMGQGECLNLGFYYSTHNDFITALIAYGLIGFFLFSYYVIVYPLKKASKNNKMLVFLLLLYIIIECCVLEPFFRGKIYVMMFYVFTLKCAIIFREDTNGSMICN